MSSYLRKVSVQVGVETWNYVEDERTIKGLIWFDHEWDITGLFNYFFFA